MFAIFAADCIKKISKIHVRYLADYRRAWILKQNIVPYTDLDTFIQKNTVKNVKVASFIAATVEAIDFFSTEVNKRLDLLEKLVTEKNEARRLKELTKNTKQENIAASNCKLNVEGKIQQQFVSSSKKNTNKLSNRCIEVKKNTKYDPKNLEERVKSNFIFKSFAFSDICSLKPEEVCSHCKEPKNLVKCLSDCNQFYHEKCDELLRNNLVLPNIVKMEAKDNKPAAANKEMFCCANCELKLWNSCQICKVEDLENLLKCQYCCYSFHRECLTRFPQSYESFDKFICPYHFCHTCYSIDNTAIRPVSNKKLLQCVMCPSSYHLDVECIPAGTEFITRSRIKCTNHISDTQRSKVNVDWCFICGIAGELVCCDTCPAALHEKCLGSKITKEQYFCDLCESGW